MRQGGFTLIEIMVTVVIIMVLSGLSIAGYNRFNDVQKVQQAASIVVSNLQAIRSKAAFGVKPTSGCDSLIGYTVEFTASSYQSSAFCQVGIAQQSVGTVFSYSLPSGVSFSPTPGDITFYALDRGASAGQTLTITGSGATKTVTILASGVISE